jgi:hypothetical protein
VLPGGPAAEDLEIASATGRLVFEGAVASGHWLMWDGGDTGQVYDADWRPAGELRASGAMPTVPQGRSVLEVRWAVAGSRTPAVEVRWILRGTPELVPRPTSSFPTS